MSSVSSSGKGFIARLGPVGLGGVGYVADIASNKSGLGTALSVAVDSRLSSIDSSIDSRRSSIVVGVPAVAAVESPETERIDSDRSLNPDGVLLKRRKGFFAGIGGLGRSAAGEAGEREGHGAGGGGVEMLRPGDLRSDRDAGEGSNGPGDGLGETLADDFGEVGGDVFGDETVGVVPSLSDGCADRDEDKMAGAMVGDGGWARLDAPRLESVGLVMDFELD
jgi:hypothetical protein